MSERSKPLVPSRAALSRRDFVRAASAGLALAPLYVPARAWGANDRIRVGFIGVGKMGMGHLNWFAAQEDVEVRAVADVEESRRELAKTAIAAHGAKLGRTGGADVALSVDYQEMLAKNQVDAVVISTPDHWHTAPLIHAAQAKKDIYCEKPLTLTIEESELAVKAVRKYNVVLQTGSQQRSENNGRFRQACEFIRSGRIGKIREVSAHFGPTAKTCDLPEEPVAGGLDWDRWLGQAPQRPYNHLLCQRGNPKDYPFLPGWRDYREFSGGQVTDWGCHHLDIVQWALGMDGGGASRIEPPRGDGARGGARIIYDKTPVGDGIVVTHRTYGNGIRFIGDSGEIFVSRGELTATPAAVLKEPLGASEVHLETPTTGHKRDWLAAIRSRKDPICKVEIGARTAALCHLVNIAYWTGKPVKWDAAKWAMTGAPASLRSRRARKGYELPKV